MIYNQFLNNIFNTLNTKVSDHNNTFTFRIINNSKGKNLIYLSSNDSKFDDKVFQDIKTSLEPFQSAIDFIETHNTLSDILKTEVLKICSENNFAHRNASYLSWNRNIQSDFSINAKIISGYSYKGGMGRSSSLAYLAYLFYFLGKKVVILDFDFEAPGIANLFFSKIEREEKGGVIDYIIDKNLGDIELNNYILNFPISDNGGNLYGIHSGIDFNTTEYLNKISKIDFNSPNYIDSISSLLTKLDTLLKPDLIIVDCRAGLSESNGFVLRQLSDINLFLFNSEEQNKDGIKVTKNIINDNNSYILNSNIRYFDEDIALKKEKELTAFLKAEKVKYNKMFSLPYNNNFLINNLELFKIFCRSQSDLYLNTSDKEIFLKNIFECLKSEFFPEETENALTELNINDSSSLKQILEILKTEFSKNIASKKFDSEENLKYFYFKEDLKKIINEQIILILGPKGSGKSTFYEIFTKNYSQIFKHLNIKNNKYIVGFSNKTPLTREFISSFNLKNKNLARRFWLYFNLYQIEQEIYDNPNDYTFSSLDILKEKIQDLEFATTVEKKLKEINISLMKENEIITLVFDELDVMFSENKDIIISSLIENSYSYIYSLPNIKTKILLRNDIFISLKIENKTHLDYNKYELIWEKKDLFSLILKIILNSLKIEDIKFLNLEHLIDGVDGNSYNIVKDESIIKAAINYMFGEKLYKAANVGASYDWIVKLLSDGNNVITPRTMYKFMHTVIEHELSKLKEDDLSREYLFKEISSSQIYKDIFNTVSKDKFSEFHDEYPNLTFLYEKIREIGYSKFTADEFKSKFKKSTTNEKINEYLEDLVNSGFLHKIQSQYNYQVAPIFAHSMHLKTNRARNKN